MREEDANLILHVIPPGGCGIEVDGNPYAVVIGSDIANRNPIFVNGKKLVRDQITVVFRDRISNVRIEGAGDRFSVVRINKKPGGQNAAA